MGVASVSLETRLTRIRVPSGDTSYCGSGLFEERDLEKGGGNSRLERRAEAESKATGDLPRLNDHVGRHWGNNGDAVVVRSAGVETNPGKGGPGGHFIAEDLDNPHGPASMVELVTPSHLAPTPSIVSYVGMGLTDAAGELLYDPASDRISLRWPPPDDPRVSRSIAAIRQLTDTLNEANTGGTVTPATVLFDPTMGGHPLGGALAGRACDLWGWKLGVGS